MMLRNKKLMMLATAAIIALPVGVVSAATTNINATASFISAITLSGTNMNFGTITYAAAPGGGDTVSLGTNSAAIYAGTFTAGGGTPAAGDVTVTAGTNGQTLEVRCDTSAVMTRTGGGSINVTNIEVRTEAATGAFGTGSACAGIGGAAATTMVLNIGTLDSFKFGGRIDGSTAVAFVAGSYSTANAGGNDIEVAVVYQ